MVKEIVQATGLIKQIQLLAFNMLGQEVAKLLDETLQAGPYKVTFEPFALPSGVYIYRLQSNGLTEARKMLLLK